MDFLNAPYTVSALTLSDAQLSEHQALLSIVIENFQLGTTEVKSHEANALIQLIRSKLEGKMRIVNNDLSKPCSEHTTCANTPVSSNCGFFPRQPSNAFGSMQELDETAPAGGFQIQV